MFAKLAVAAAALAATSVVAQPPPPGTWYGIAPDDTIQGQINIFTMTPTGTPLNGVGAVLTSDQEYVKEGTFSCLWGSDACYFLTGVARPYTQDAIYGLNRTTGQLIFKHEVPAGIYLDNLVLDWNTDTLYSIAFNPQDGSARIVTYNGATGEVTILNDITQDLEGGVVYGSSVSVCPTTGTLFIGVDENAGLDQVLAYNIAANPPTLTSKTPLLFGVPGGLHAFCNATAFEAMAGTYIQSDDIFRETVQLVDLQKPGQIGLPFPLGNADLPTFSARGETPLFLSGMMSEFQGTFIVPIFPPFQRGPGPAPALPGGLVFTWQYSPNPSTPGRLSPIGYFLAGAAGVPGR